MTEDEAISKMVAPSMNRSGRWLGGILQIKVTRVCDASCINCTQGSQLKGPHQEMTPEQFEIACQSLQGYQRVVGLFGGNPATTKAFPEYCRILRKYIGTTRAGLWCNNPITLENATLMRSTFNPGYSVLNCHLNEKAYELFKKGWPESRPFGQDHDSRHSPPWVAMKDIIADEGKRWELIAQCDINQYWSAAIGLFRGQLRAWVCEIMAAQSELHQDDPDYPDTGVALPLPPGATPWWTWPMSFFQEQVRKHCHECGVPLRGYGELACAAEDGGVEQVSATHAGIYKTKRPGRRVEVVTSLEQLGMGRLKTGKLTDYVANARA